MTHMATNLVTTPITKRAAECFTEARKNLMEGAKYLHEIKAKELWKESHESYSDYLQDECRISDSFASKLVQVYEHYCLNGSFSLKALEGVDIEKAYLALKMPDKSPRHQLEAAKSLSRGELKNELNDPDDSCKHLETYRACANCHKRV